METRNYILATAGHVDHGKSALIQALTGGVTDRLPEEKRRGITIDLGFTHWEFRYQTSSGRQLCFRLGIVDVPGHEDFVKNMVAGVGAIDAALLAVAADDGWMLQTEEHVQILMHLGVTKCVVAVTKADLMEGEEELVREDVLENLQGTPFATSPIVFTSAAKGYGLAELKQELGGLLEHTTAPEDIGCPRLAVDRAFALKGVGTVVTGTLTGGRMERGEELLVEPEGLITRVRTLQTHHREVEHAGPGERVALHLTDVAVAQPGLKGVARGSIVATPGAGITGKFWDVRLDRSARLKRIRKSAGRPLKEGVRVLVHHGSGYYPARVYTADHRPLDAGCTQLVQLRFEEPVCGWVGDRFVIRDWSGESTLGGGVVLDVEAAQQMFRTAVQQKCLKQREGGPRDPVVLVSSNLQREHCIRLETLGRGWWVQPAALQSAIDVLLKGGKVLKQGGWLVDREWWETCLREAMQTVEKHHEQYPEQPGMELSVFREFFATRLHSPELLEFLVRNLAGHQIVQSGTIIHRKSHQPGLSPRLVPAANRIRNDLSEHPQEPPSRKSLVTNAEMREALKFLVHSGEVVEVNAELVMLSTAYRQLVDRIRDHLASQGPSTVSDLRKSGGVSRRIMVPVLERLDQERVTRREGDLRKLVDS